MLKDGNTSLLMAGEGGEEYFAATEKVNKPDNRLVLNAVCLVLNAVSRGAIDG